ncbi:MAG: RNA polymerase sigma factor (sigma-70 family) [Mariniblastus sp.]|jgi:RNA polymerase sigma factor (sigma-70 family)
MPDLRNEAVKTGRVKTKRRQLVAGVNCYLDDALQTPLLDADQELRLANEIVGFRLAFQRTVLHEPEVLKHLIGLLSRLNLGTVRIDSVCNLGLNESEKRNQVEPKIEPAIRKLKKILKRQTKAIENDADAATLKSLHAQAVESVEPLLIRPGHFESAPFDGFSATELLAAYRSACQEMIRANLRLVVRITRQLCGNSPLLLDLIQEGNRGLMHAVVKFDPGCQVRFATYASLWIRQYVFSALPNLQRTIRVPENFRAVSRGIKDQVRKLRKERFEFRDSESAQVVAEIADRMNMQPTEIARHMRIQRDACSLDQPFSHSVDGEGQPSSLLEVLVDNNKVEPSRVAEVNEQSAKVRAMMDQVLTRREHRVISLRFGFDHGENRSFAEVGREMGLTRQRVCQVAKQAMLKLVKLAENMDCSCFQ